MIVDGVTVDPSIDYTFNLTGEHKIYILMKYLILLL